MPGEGDRSRNQGRKEMVIHLDDGAPDELELRENLNGVEGLLHGFTIDSFGKTSFSW
jgi:hypothetical protein